MGFEPGSSRRELNVHTNTPMHFHMDLEYEMSCTRAILCTIATIKEQNCPFWKGRGEEEELLYKYNILYSSMMCSLILRVYIVAQFLSYTHFWSSYQNFITSCYPSYLTKPPSSINVPTSPKGSIMHILTHHNYSSVPSASRFSVSCVIVSRIYVQTCMDTSLQSVGYFAVN